ncbi:MAG: AbrB/MazE/SpoVT family DNA-binding domain-containing protein, partial [Candidatus Thermoplasmatota archaeon]|nr:AbrB/MazE/SpoVT family DNA-binding domain-containing protein [Candidatus Thermoplasmatota archaeon]
MGSKDNNDNSPSPILVKRKIVKTGNSLTITLPKEWLRYNNLEKGNDLCLLATGDIIIVSGDSM